MCSKYKAAARLFLSANIDHCDFPEVLLLMLYCCWVFVSICAKLVSVFFSVMIFASLSWQPCFILIMIDIFLTHALSNHNYTTYPVQAGEFCLLCTVGLGAGLPY